LSATLDSIRTLVAAGKVIISVHGYDELAADDIFVADVLAGLGSAQVVEDYPDAVRGPSVLVLAADSAGDLFHAVWGIPKGKSEPAVLVTAYRPDPQLWLEGFLERRK
jgi:hypothetical protein